MSFPSAFRGETYNTCVVSLSSPPIAFRTNQSMQVRNAARVFPDPVGAEINVVLLARIWGQPCSCGSVAAPNRPVNHSWTMGWAQLRVGKFIGTLSAYRSLSEMESRAT